MQILNTVLKIILLVNSIGLIALVMLQEGKSAGLSGAIAGGAETFFGKNKARSMEYKLVMLTKVAAVIFFVLCACIVFIQRFL